ncbi:hypothetical protein URH17368_2987 [Alicyclobacillus hesperidum URH17-3-68]|nr:hypothetical protein URH17368_2987 [Alicyclobacillus hesperidum URH17-3-68]
MHVRNLVALSTGENLLLTQPEHDLRVLQGMIKDASYRCANPQFGLDIKS